MLPVVVTLAAVAALVECPSADAVRARLDQLRPGARDTDQSLTVRRLGDAMELRVRSASGEALQRTVPAGTSSCDELETAAAVMALAWDAEFGSVSLPESTLSRPVEAPVTPSTPLAVELGGGPSMWLSGAGLTWGGEGFALLGARDGRLRGALLVSGQGRRDVTISPGQVTYSRLSFGLGPDLTLLRRTVRLSMGAQAMSGVLWLQGRGFDQNSAVTSFDLGVRGGFRAELDTGAVRPFVSLGAVVWVLRHVARVSEANVNAPPSGEIPVLDAQLTVGVAWEG